MTSRRIKDLMSAKYLENLGITSARAYAPIIRRQAGENNLELPLGDANVVVLLDNTIVGLETQTKLDWKKLPSERSAVFINAWHSEMQKQGIVQ
jgi:hypothetical protein